MIKSLFLDIDGTLVSFKTHEIPASTIEALTEAKAKGIEIYISTGRPYALIDNIAPISHLVDGYITTNGAFCFVGDHEVACDPISRHDVDTIIAKSKEMGFPCMVVGEKDLTMFNSASNPQIVSLVSHLLNVPGIERERPIEGVLSQRILQLSPFITESQEHEILPSLEAIESGRWHPDFTDLTAKGVSKAKGLREIARYRGLDISETMAFGDGGNDLPIIRAAGIGVAMGNAGDAVKEAADYTTTSVDDNGIRNALRHWKII